MKKICYTCKKEKELVDFYQRKDSSYRGECKTCLLSLQKDRWKARKVKAVELLGGCCSECGYKRNLAALDFHHVNPVEKEFNWNRLVKKPWPVVLAELKKCIIFCRNCHAEFHNPNYTLKKIDGFCANFSLDEDSVVSLVPTGVCPSCNAETYGTKYCSRNCVQKSQRKVVRPSPEQLSQDMKEMNWTAIGRKYNVSDNAVRKWVRHYNL